MALVLQSQGRSELRTRLQLQARGILSRQREFRGFDWESAFVNKKKEIECMDVNMAVNVAVRPRTREQVIQRR